MKKLFVFIVAVMSIVGMVTAAQAYSTFFGEDLGLGESTRLSSHLNADNARNAFLSNLVGVGTETFESYSDGAVPTTLNFVGAGTATFAAGSGYVTTVATGTNGVGRYPISGINYLETSSSSFSIDFSAPVAAFGFYGIDIGDFGGQVTLSLLSGGSLTINIGNTMNGAGGSVLYFGIIDTENPFTKVTFGNTAAGTDYFGFDDLTVGSVEQVQGVPEPATILLFGLGLAGLAGLRRKFQK